MSMKKYLVFTPNTEPELARLYSDVTHWVSNNRNESLGSIVRVKVGRKFRYAFEAEDYHVYMTSECLRQCADFIDKLNESAITVVQQAAAQH
jgi:hypothetical protein